MSQLVIYNKARKEYKWDDEIRKLVNSGKEVEVGSDLIARLCTSQEIPIGRRSGIERAIMYHGESMCLVMIEEKNPSKD